MQPFILRIVLLEREAEEVKRRERSAPAIFSILSGLASWVKKKDARPVSDTQQTGASIFLEDCATGCK